jgi:hypothetical protein
MANIDRVKKIIIELMKKTIDNGCTEEEAIAASAKAQQLLHDYQLDLSDIEIRDSKCETGTYETNWHKPMHIWYCLSSIGYFTDTKVWRHRNKYTNWEVKYFGLEHDVLIASYITKVCNMALILGGEDYMKTISHYSAAQKRDMRDSFGAGMAARISERLREMKDAQKLKDVETTGRDLVVVKNAVVEEEYAKLGLKLGKPRGARKNYDLGAFRAGRAEGDKVAINPGVGQNKRGAIR